jgi:hypothetical protein
VPEAYYKNPTANFPILLMLHGMGEKVWAPQDLSQLNLVRKYGPAMLIDQGQEFPFIVITPQCPFSSWSDVAINNFQTTVTKPGEFVNEIYDMMESRYRIDKSREYLTGISMGGADTYTYLSTNSNRIAAAIPISGWGNTTTACVTASQNIAIWAFQGGNDGAAGVQNIISAINGCKPAPSVPAKITVYPGMGHNVWDITYNNSGAGIAPDNIYNWLMRQSKSIATTPPPVNIPPVSNAGADKAITLPTNTITFSGTGTDKDGTIASYLWAQISGTSCTLTGANTSTLSVSALAAGSYAYTLTVTDNAGASAKDTVLLTVNSASKANVPPIANAGPDQTITLPTSTIALNGSGKDSDGTIASSLWSQVSGPACTLSNVTGATLTLSALTAGSYKFALVVTDNLGATGKDTVLLTVNPASKANTAPIANAGPDQTITLPTSTIALNGSGKDSDGTIASSLWSQVSGPACTLSNVTGTTLTLSALTAGSYKFALVVTDNLGATGKDTVMVTVNNMAQAVASGAGTGLYAEYFANQNLTGTPFTTEIDPTINFDWGNNAPITGMPVDLFSMRWTGKVVPNYTETYTFYNLSDGGIRIWVNGVLIIDNWTAHAAYTESTGTIAFQAGMSYDIKIEYYDTWYEASNKLSWSSAHQAKQIVPKESLYPANASLRMADAIGFEANSVLSAFPMPIKDIVYVNFSSTTSGEAEIKLLNDLAQVRFQTNVPVTSGNNTATLDVSQLGSGVYILVVNSADKTETTRVVITK